MKFFSRSAAATLLLALLGPGHVAAVIPNCWHIPDNAGDLGINMRNPEFEIGTSTAVTVYSGIQKFNNPYGTANQIAVTPTNAPIAAPAAIAPPRGQ